MIQTLSLDEIKTKQQITWATGNYSIVGATLQIVGENLCESMDLISGSTVLDVCAGNGNATLAAARRYCKVTSIDYVQSLLEAGSQRAKAEGFDSFINFQVADVENLPFDKHSFDYVLSTFGVMFSPNQELSASELLRVVKPEGKIGLANWTPNGFIGQMFKLISSYVPPFPGLKSPALWGTSVHLEKLFGDKVSVLKNTKKDFHFRYRSPQHFVEVFKKYYGPTNKAFSSLNESTQRILDKEISNLIKIFNISKNESMNVPSEYLEVVLELK